PNSVWERWCRNSVSGDGPDAKRSFASCVPKQSLGTRISRKNAVGRRNISAIPRTAAECCLSWHGRRAAWQSGMRAVPGARLHMVAHGDCWRPEAVPAVSTHYRAEVRVAQRKPHAEREGYDGQTARTFAALGLSGALSRSRVRVCSSVSGTGVEPVTPRFRV